MQSREYLLYIINSLQTGGAEVGMCRLLDGLDSKRYDVTVVSLNGYEDAILAELPDWVEFVDLRLPAFPPRIVQLVPRIRRADIIVGSLFHSVLIARGARVLNTEATIATWQHNSQFKNRHRKRLYGITNRFTDILLADSQAVANFLAEQFGSSQNKIRTVPIAGIQPKNYSVIDHSGTEDLTVGTVGSLTKQKNHHMILDIAAELSGDKFSFEIAGGGELYDELLQKKDNMDLSHVTFHGTVDDIPTFLSTLDIYIQPSLYEGLCITVLEAMATGLPVVGSDVGGISQNVAHNKYGYLHEPHDRDSFVSSITYLGKKPDIRQQFGENAREFVMDNYTQDVLVSEFERAVRAPHLS